MQQAIWRYRSTVLSAVEEVENSLVAYQQEQHRLEKLRHAVDASQQALNLSTENYKQGIVRFQTVLDAQRTLLSLQDQVVSSQATVALQRVALFKAIGGGWESPTAEEDRTLSFDGLIQSDGEATSVP